MDDSLIAQLYELRHRAAPLDPSPQERAHLLDAVGTHVEEFLRAVTTQRAYYAPEAHDGLSGLGDLPRRPRSAQATLDLFARTVERTGVATTSPRYVGYVPAGGLFHAALANFLASAVNPYSALHRVNPGAVEIEAVVVRWLADGLGLPPEAGGVLTSGGSTATLTALVAARDHGGVSPADGERAMVYLTEDTHHSLTAALHVAGLERVTRRRIPVDGARRLDVRALREAVRADRAAGRRPWLLAATAGTVHTGAVDPLAELADLAAAEGLWLHVDGAYGGLYALCPEGRAVLGGIERADSVVVDPHKTLFLPYGTGAVLVRRGALLRASFGGDAAYLDRRREDDAPDSPADLSIELTRPFRALGLWLALQLAGTDAFEAALSEKLLLARYAHARLAAQDRVETGPPPDLGIVIFRPRTAQQDREQCTTAVLDRLQHGGVTFLTPTRIDGELWLRIAVGSFRTHRADLDTVLDAVLDAVVEAVDATGEHAARPTHPAPDERSPRISPSRRTVTSSHPHRPDTNGTTDRIDTTVSLQPAPEPLLRVRIARDRATDAAARQCELDVLGGRYGDTAELLAEAYGAYEDRTVFVALEHLEDGVVGFVRLIAPGGSTLIKTLADIEKPPWQVDGRAVADEAGLELSATWDIATIGLRPDIRDNPMIGTQVGIAAGALYHASLLVPLANGGRWFVAILDHRVRALIARAGLILDTLPGTGPQPYMGSPACVPVVADIARLFANQQLRAPEVHRTFWADAGGGAVSLPSGQDLIVPHTVVIPEPAPRPTT